MALNLVIIFGSVRSDRQGIKAARFVPRQLVERGHTVTLVDPREYQLPLLDRMYKEYAKGTALEQLERLATLYRAADGFVMGPMDSIGLGDHEWSVIRPMLAKKAGGLRACESST